MIQAHSPYFRIMLGSTYNVLALYNWNDMNILDALALKELKGVGDETISSLLIFAAANGFKTLEDIAGVRTQNLSLKRTPSSLVEFLKLSQFESARNQISEKLEEWRLHGIEVIMRGDAKYPPHLLEVVKPPPFLFCKGNVDLLQSTKAIAVVGTRNNTALGKELTKSTVEAFASKGFAIISGLALGIDAIAHRAALDFRVPTIAVLVDLATISPAVNRKLANEILGNGGLWVSENPPGTRSIPALFARRDRIQAGLASAVFAIETTIDGGTMHAVNASYAMGRPVFVPDSQAAGYPDLSIPAISGTQNLVREQRASYYSEESYEKIHSDLLS